MKFPNLATDKNRWWALVFLSLGLAIVIIDNSVLNVAIPYILRDLKTTFDAMQWVISGYALIIATILITVGRLGDLFGRKKIFLLGTVFFAAGSFIASISPNIYWLFIGEALIEAVGAAMMMTSSLALLVTEFHGKERALAFGVWGSVAAASGSLGPLLGGFLTTYYSWRWSLRINVIVAIIAILGSVFVQESQSDEKKNFDWLGTLFSGLGLFFLVFGFIEGRNYGWWTPVSQFSIGNWTWSLANISIIPFVFGLAAIFLAIFAFTEYLVERSGRSPLMRLSLFTHSGFTLGLLTLAIVVMGQFGIFLVLPIYLQNVLGFSAFQSGLAFLWASATGLIFGPLSGLIAAKVGPKWIVTIGMCATAIGTYLLIHTMSTSSTTFDLAPGLIFFGIGLGFASSQLTNIVLSNAPTRYAGEASAVNGTMRQVGTSVGIAIIGTILASSLSANIPNNIQADKNIPEFLKATIIQKTKNINAEGGQQKDISADMPQKPICSLAATDSTCIKPNILAAAVKSDINNSLVAGAKDALRLAMVFTLLGAFFSLFIPNLKQHTWQKPEENASSAQVPTKKSSPAAPRRKARTFKKNK